MRVTHQKVMFRAKSFNSADIVATFGVIISFGQLQGHSNTQTFADNHFICMSPSLECPLYCLTLKIDNILKMIISFL